MLTLSHAGDRGDLLAALASFPALGDVVDLVLYRTEGMVREPWFPAKVEALRPLLELQPYIRSVRYSDVPEGRVLDGWRRGRWGRVNLADMFAQFLGVPHPPRTTPWLVVDRADRVADVVVHRSPRYHDRSRFPWRQALATYQGRVVMVGTVEEHQAFTREVGPIPYYPTATWLDLARVIAGVSLFVGNQSAPYWLATGLMRPTWLEQDRGRQGNCHWERPGAYWDGIRPPV